MAHSIDTYYPHDSGDFLSQNEPLPSLARFASLDADPAVEPIRDSKTARSFNGLGTIIGIKTSYRARVGNRSYDAIRLEPTSECDPLDHTVDTTPAFACRHDDGLFYDMAMTAMRAGFDVTIMSPETHTPVCPSPRTTARNYIALSDRIDDIADREPTVSHDKMGVSRGLILAIKQLEMLHEYGRPPGDVEGIGAVYHKRNSLREDMALYAQFLPNDVIPEVVTALRAPRRIPTLAKTVVNSPQKILHTASSIGALRKSDVGKSLGHLHPHTTGTITLYERDTFRDQDAHAESYSHYKGIVVRRVPGAVHTSFISQEEQQALGERIRKRAASLRSGGGTSIAS